MKVSGFSGYLPACAKTAGASAAASSAASTGRRGIRVMVCLREVSVIGAAQQRDQCRGERKRKVEQQE